MDSTLAHWLGDYFIHSSFLILLVLGLERLPALSHPLRRERLWRAALVLGLVSATLQNLPLGLDRPVAQRPLAVTVPATLMPATMELERPATTPLTQGSNRAATEPLAPATVSLSEQLRGVVVEHGASLLIGAWALIAALLLLRLMLAARSGFALLRDRRPIVEGRERRIADELIAASEGASPVRLSASRRLSGPVTLPGAEVCLPERALATLNDQQLRAMLAHEIGHAQRRDAEWRLLVNLICAVLFLQPLNRLVRAKLSDCAELVCDDWAAVHTGDGRALAECLVEVASWMHPTPVDAFATPMAEHGATLRDRVSKLLCDRFGDAGSGWRERGVTVTALVALLLLGPGLVMVEAEAARDSGHTMIEQSGSSFNFYREDDEQSLHVEGNGRIRFSESEDRVVSISQGGRLEIEDERGGIERELAYRGAADGSPELVRYRVDGDDQPLDAAAREWLGVVIPEIYRMSGIQAEERAARIFARGGADALLEELRLIGSDYVSKLYFGEYFERVDGDSDDLVAGLELAGRSIGSDFELRETLTTALSHIDGDRAATRAFLAAATSIGSDFEAAELLIAAYGHMAPGDDVASAYLDVAETIGSDFELKRALTEALDSDWLVESQGARILELAREEIGSDFEMAELLIAFAHARELDDELVRGIILAGEGVGSDFELARVLRVVLSAGDLNEANAVLLLEMAGEEIGSDHELAELLLAANKRVPESDAVNAAFARAADTLNGHDYKRVMSRR